MDWTFTPSMNELEHHRRILSRAREWYQLRLSGCPYQRPSWRPPAGLVVTYDRATQTQGLVP